MDISNEVRLVLVGRTGTGRSSIGNSLLKKEIFRRYVSSVSVTQECKRGDTIRNGTHLAVVDTPGLFHTNIKQDLVKKEIVKCMKILSPGPHAFLYVFRISRHSTEDEKTLVELEDVFGEEFCKYCIILFVTDNSLLKGNIEEFVETLPYFYRALVDKCSGRVLTGCADEEYNENMLRQIITFQKEIAQEKLPYFSIENFSKSKSILYRVVFKPAKVMVGWLQQKKKIYVILYMLIFGGGCYYMLCNSPTPA